MMIMPHQAPLFVSHGAPTIVLDGSAAHAFLKAQGRAGHAPRAILVASAHFEAPGPTLTASAAPPTIHDFGNFGPEMYAMRYPAPGDPTLAQTAAGLLSAAGFAPRLDPARGLDHGAWTPLMLMYPAADIPVVQVSVDPTRDAAWHYRMGQALAPLADEDVLILGSGSLTHDLAGFFRGGYAETAAPDASAQAFARWIETALADGRLDDLLHWDTRAPDALRHHPTPEHFLPLFVALGASRSPQAHLIHRSFSHAVLALDAYAMT